MKLDLSDKQISFIQYAINLQEFVIDYDMENKEFKKLFGFSKNTMIKEVKDLYNKINKK